MKTIFFKLLLILFILLAIILLYQPTKEKDSLYKGKENEDVYVSVQVGDNIQKNTQILVDIVYCVRRMNMIIYKYKERCSIIKNEELERSRFFKDHL